MEEQKCHFTSCCYKLQISSLLLSSVGKARLGSGSKPRRKCMPRKCNALVMSLWEYAVPGKLEVQLEWRFCHLTALLEVSPLNSSVVGSDTSIPHLKFQYTGSSTVVVNLKLIIQGVFLFQSAKGKLSNLSEIHAT